MSRKQKTIQTEASVSGVGLHSGETTTVTVRPAPENTGVVFRRVDIDGAPEVAARTDYLTDRIRRTALALGSKAEVHTIEHLMATFFMAGIDNVYVDINGYEVPGMDGSSVPFCGMLDKAGLVEQNAPRRAYSPVRPIGVEGSNGTSVSILPHDGLRVSYVLDYKPDIPVQYFSMDLTNDVFRKEIAPARTFCLEREVEQMKTLGLGKGATYDNTLVVSEGGTPVNNTCRFPDEYVRHKVLDLIGDIALMNADVKGHIIAVKSGHQLNGKFTERLRTEAHWQEIESLVTGPPVYDPRGLLRCLPHRYPMLLLDKIVYMNPRKKAIGIKNVTFNEEFFQGHFPGQPVMPGVLICEAMAQLGCTLIIEENDTSKIAFLMGMDNVKLRQPVVPGDTMVIVVENVKVKSRFGQVKGNVYVNRTLVAEADLKCMIVDAAQNNAAAAGANS